MNDVTCTACGKRQCDGTHVGCPSYLLDASGRMNERTSVQKDEGTIARPGPEYLGDGVYASFDGYHLWLTTGSHEERDASNRIALEPGVYAALVRYQARVAATMKPETA